MSTKNKLNNDIFSQVYRLFTEHFIQLVYHGAFTSQKADILINIFEQLLGQYEARQKIQKRAFYILVEALQNVIRHQVKPGPSLKESVGTLTFRYLDGQFMFTLKNLMETRMTADLRKKIDMLNRMTREELNKYYKKILKNDVLSDKGGAGLGLIEIARKSENLLQYEFKEVDDTYSYFYLNMLVADARELFPESGINITKQLHRLLQDAGNWLVLREEFHAGLSPDLQLSLGMLAGEKLYAGKFKKFLSLLDRVPKLCLAASGLSHHQVRMPFLFFFVMEKSGFSVYTGLSLPYSSPFDLTFLSNFFTQKTIPKYSADRLDLQEEELKPLLALPSLLSSPPRIMIREISPSEKFILLKFSF